MTAPNLRPFSLPEMLARMDEARAGTLVCDTTGSPVTVYAYDPKVGVIGKHKGAVETWDYDGAYYRGELGITSLDLRFRAPAIPYEPSDEEADALCCEEFTRVEGQPSSPWKPQAGERLMAKMVLRERREHELKAGRA